jgi:hypothetical protein
VSKRIYVKVKGGKAVEIARPVQGFVRIYDPRTRGRELERIVKHRWPSDGVWFAQIDYARIQMYVVGKPKKVNVTKKIAQIEKTWGGGRVRAGTALPGVRGYQRRANASGAAQRNREAEAKGMLKWLRLQEATTPMPRGVLLSEGDVRLRDLERQYRGGDLSAAEPLRKALMRAGQGKRAVIAFGRSSVPDWATHVEVLLWREYPVSRSLQDIAGEIAEEAVRRARLTGWETHDEWIRLIHYDDPREIDALTITITNFQLSGTWAEPTPPGQTIRGNVMATRSATGPDQWILNPREWERGASLRDVFEHLVLVHRARTRGARWINNPGVWFEDQRGSPLWEADIAHRDLERQAAQGDRTAGMRLVRERLRLRDLEGAAETYMLMGDFVAAHKIHRGLLKRTPWDDRLRALWLNSGQAADKPTYKINTTDEETWRDDQHFVRLWAVEVHDIEMVLPKGDIEIGPFRSEYEADQEAREWVRDTEHRDGVTYDYEIIDRTPEDLEREVTDEREDNKATLEDVLVELNRRGVMVMGNQPYSSSWDSDYSTNYRGRDSRSSVRVEYSIPMDPSYSGRRKMPTLLNADYDRIDAAVKRGQTDADAIPPLSLERR